MEQCAREAPRDLDLTLVEGCLQALRDYSNLAAAEALGISEATVRRWRGGNIAVPLRTSTRLALRSFADLHGISGKSRHYLDAGAALLQSTAVQSQIFTSLDQIRAYIAEVGPPGDDQGRKMDVLLGIRQVITARSAVPDWWYQLRDLVQGGEL